MVRSIDPKREAIRGAQRYSDTAAVFGTRVAETISASGQGRPQQQAGHMAASDPIKTLRRLLQARGRPHMAFAGEAGLSEVLHFLVNRVTDSEHLLIQTDQ